MVRAISASGIYYYFANPVFTAFTVALGDQANCQYVSFSTSIADKLTIHEEYCEYAANIANIGNILSIFIEYWQYLHYIAKTQRILAVFDVYCQYSA